MKIVLEIDVLNRNELERGIDILEYQIHKLDEMQPRLIKEKVEMKRKRNIGKNHKGNGFG